MDTNVGINIDTFVASTFFIYIDMQKSYLKLNLFINKFSNLQLKRFHFMCELFLWLFSPLNFFMQLFEFTRTTTLRRSY